MTQLDDDENGFWYLVGYMDWYPKHITEELGKTWLYNYGMQYKPYPTCSMWHGLLDCFYEIIEKNNLSPEEIESVKAYARVPMDHPLYGNKTIKNIEDAQFNARYIFSVAAHRVKIGIDWLDPETINNPDIQRFMDKVTWLGHPDYMKELENNPMSSLSKAEVVARGKTFTVERKNRRGTTGTDARWTEKDAVEKFRHNAVRILTKDKINNAVEALLELDKIGDISQLMRQVTL